MPSFFHLLPFSVNDIICQVNACIGGTQPYKTMVTLPEITRVAVVVVVIESVLNSVQRVSVNIRIITGNEYTTAQAQFQSQISFPVERTSVTDTQTSATAFAFPALLLVESDTVYPLKYRRTSNWPSRT